MNVIIFGVDNSGKTTLANKIAEQFGLEYVRSIGPGHTKQEYLDFLMLKLDEGDKVFDRFSIIEENVNGPVLRGHSTMADVDSSKYFDKADVIIFADPGIETVTRWGEREQMDGIKENVEKLYFEYCRMAEAIALFATAKFFRYDWHKTSDRDEIFNYISSKMEKR